MKKIHYTLVLDRSSSMSTIRAKTLEGINAQIGSVINNGEREGVSITSSLLLFDQYGNYDQWFQFVYQNKPSTELKPLTWDEYSPRGGTPLNDAIGLAVKATQADTDDETERVVAIFTDGEENSSREFKREQIAEMIKSLEETGKWTFTFVGAGLEAQVQSVARSYNIAPLHVASYDGSEKGAAHTFSLMAAAVSGCTTRSIRGQSVADLGVQNYFTAAENFEGAEPALVR